MSSTSKGRDWGGGRAPRIAITGRKLMGEGKGPTRVGQPEPRGMNRVQRRAWRAAARQLAKAEAGRGTEGTRGRRGGENPTSPGNLSAATTEGGAA